MKHRVGAKLAGERLDKAVAALGGISRSRARAIVDEGAVAISGEPVTDASSRVGEGMVLEFEVPVLESVLVPHEVEYGTVYVDDDLIVVDKPPGLTVHPGSGTGAATLAAGLLHDHPEIEGVGEPGRWGIVHRLDKATSGLLVVARTSAAHEVLVAMMRAREITRRYVAFVAGVMDIPRGTVDAPIGPDPNRPTRRSLSPFGKRAITHYRQVSAWPSRDVARLDVTLETGRTHQIRVHLSGIGHPVLGDRVYGGGWKGAAPSRLALHAAHLELHHPVTGDPMTFEADLPEDLAAFEQSLGPPG